MIIIIIRATTTTSTSTSTTATTGVYQRKHENNIGATIGNEKETWQSTATSSRLARGTLLSGG